MSVEIFARQDDVLGEGPLWSAAEQALYWLDIGRKRLHRRTLDGTRTAWDLPGRPGCVGHLRDGDLVVAAGEDVHRFVPATGATRLLCKVGLPPRVRFNEGKVDPGGRLWIGSMQDNFGPRGEPVILDRFDGVLLRLDGRGSFVVMEEKVGISNTLAWSPDATRFYFADTLVNAMFVYDYDPASGAVTNKRLFFNASGVGLPDGSAMAADGCLWNARYQAGLILRITPQGRIDRRIEVPAPQVTSCAFGGPGLDTLFVTSARHGLSAPDVDRAPHSGSVFAISGVGPGMPIPAMGVNGP